jgi:site-specific DNA-methyltransferase (adenine-specific)
MATQPKPILPEVQGLARLAADSASTLKLVFSDEAHGIWLYQADCLEALDVMAGSGGAVGTVDVIFSDPPYFLSNGGVTCHSGRRAKVDKGDWDKSRGPDSNHEFTREWLSRCQRVLKPNGTIWVTGTQHIIFSVGFAMQQLGFKILNTITWEKPNPPPNLSCRYFTHSTELVIWAARDSKSRHVFNYQAMRQANHGKQMKTVWKLAAPSAAEKRAGKHPTQKPIALVERCLQASSREGDLVLDPFAGAGTTPIAALRLNRKCVAFDVDAHWIRVAADRAQAVLVERRSETMPLLRD